MHGDPIARLNWRNRVRITFLPGYENFSRRANYREPT
jgi:hypothetical protein